MTERIDHTACSHSATPKARTCCRLARNKVLRDARNVFVSGSEGYDEHVHRVALVFNIDVSDAYILIEEAWI